MSLPVLPERDDAKYYSQTMIGESNQEKMTAQRRTGRGYQVFNYVNPPPQDFFLT